MKHTLKQIIGGKTEMSYVCNGVVYYYITVDKTIYQLELDTKDEVEFKDVYFTPTFKTLSLMRWIRKAIENNTLIQLNE